MKVFTAPEEIHNPIGLPTVFLAGGIVKCEIWQQQVIDKLEDWDHAILLNPRRENYPWNDPAAEVEQITWEFDGLDTCDVFSMWFCASQSDQPVCMYELGRNLARQQVSPGVQTVIGVEPGYRRERDVEVQVSLVDPTIEIHSTLDEHVMNILKALENC